MNENEILHLLKHGRSEELQDYIKTIQRENYSEDFSQFIDEMLREYKVKRKEIAIRSGMSQDYTYKLLRGDKKTTERDYILAICMAIGMNLEQVQHALRIYGMPVLNNADVRSHIISLAIQQGCNIDTLDDWLEKSKLNLLKTNPDMPSSPIIPMIQDDLLPVSPFSKTNQPITDETSHQYEELNRCINAEHCGNAPMDYNYWGYVKIQDENGNVYYVEAAFHPEGEHLDVLTEEMHDKFEARAKAQNEYMQSLYEKYGEELNDYEKIMSDPELQKALSNMPEAEEGIEAVEEFDSLVDAAGSPFFYWYLEIDKATDDKVQEVMEKIDDTRNYGVRYGAKFHQQLIYYMEAFNTQQPEKREYFQIVQRGDEYTYSVSHESYFMRTELEEIYPIYFGEKAQEPEYFIRVNNLNELDGSQLRYRFIFTDLKLGMHQFAHQYYGLNIENTELNDEKIRSLTQQATHFYHAERPKEAIAALEEAYPLMKQKPLTSFDRLPSLIVTCSKLADFYLELSDEEKVNQ